MDKGECQLSRLILFFFLLFFANREGTLNTHSLHGSHNKRQIAPVFQVKAKHITITETRFHNFYDPLKLQKILSYKHTGD